MWVQLTKVLVQKSILKFDSLKSSLRSPFIMIIKKFIIYPFVLNWESNEFIFRKCIIH
jgi:hypothetical protein